MEILWNATTSRPPVRPRRRVCGLCRLPPVVREETGDESPTDAESTAWRERRVDFRRGATALRPRIRARGNELSEGGSYPSQPQYWPPEWANSTLADVRDEGRVQMRERGDLLALFDVGGHYRGYLTNNIAMLRVLRDDDDEYYYIADSTNLFWEDAENDTWMKRILMDSDFVWKGTTVRNGTTLYRY